MSNEKNSEQILRDFLVYSYFGIVPKNIYDDDSFEKQPHEDYTKYCKKRAIMVAYRDATNQGAYNTLFKDEFENKKVLIDDSDKARNKSAIFLFDEISASRYATNFKDWHKRVCSNLIENYENVKQSDDVFFTYGNAQKWVNMTMKYLWLLGLLDDSFDYKELHIPVDSFIIDAVCKDDDGLSVAFPIKGKGKDKNTKLRTYVKPSDHVSGWSQWNDDAYGAFRSNLPKKYSLRWENDAWIKQAEKRKKTDLKKKYESFFGEIDT